MRRIVCSDVAALDQALVYNRFGSHNPFGMIFALARDLVPLETPGTSDCDADPGVHETPENLSKGNVRLRDCKRPRPLTLRANVGDVVHVRLRNYLRRPDSLTQSLSYSDTFCRQGGESGTYWRGLLREDVTEGDPLTGGEALARTAPDGQFVAVMCRAGSQSDSASYTDDAEAGDWPRTRGISFVIDGLRPLPDPATGRIDDVCIGLGLLEPGAETVDCYWHAEREGPYFINSVGAPSGGEGDGGSLTHGLFGSLAVEPQSAGAGATQWFRSQVSQGTFDAVWSPDAASAQPHDRDGGLNYDKVGESGAPLLNLLKDLGEGRFELVHNELNAIIQPQDAAAFREFTVVFHDELKTFYTRNFEELGRFEQLAGVRDGFAINYGSSGLGAMILANRKGIGPTADCMECLYEEFFLESWANGDPALLEGYSDDPSNVHHSYLNDPIVFRNYHAGPKETHVFHLHAHQWFAGNDPGQGTYLDSQTVAPRQGFTYNIYDGGLDDYRPDSDTPDASGWWNARGAGNRNRTVGDSIFHCHLYPHFAQGMWSLWRVHDVLEDGSRRLPDGQPTPGLSVDLLERDPGGSLPPARIGSVGADGSFVQNAAGTPIPGLIPLPDLPAPLLPTYAGDVVDAQVVSAEEAVSGYPFFVAGEPGHRAPQAPLDIARTDDGTDWLDGGLPRHVVLGGSKRALGIEIPDGTLDADTASASGSEMSPLEDALYRLTAKMLALGDFTGHLTEARIRVLPNDGDVRERGAMTFHHDGAGLALLDAQGAPSAYAADRGGYRSALASDGTATGYFAVNGAPPKPGAPFADPCGAPSGYALIDPEDPDSEHPTPELKLTPDPFRPANGESYPDFVPDPALSGFRRYEVSAVQVDIVTNKAGWHDPQGRINVLTERSDAYKDRGPSAREEPFFFRAYSGDCIEFRHTNELPKELELDDFQVQTPTDTIGQHIHLVKFDVTSADGSGNGFNYEDGTFAADEIALRLCAMLDGAADTPSLGAGSQVAGSKVAAMSEADWSGLCKKDTDHWVPKDKAHWAAKRGDNPARFQTTVQRWFADPILSIEASGGDEEADRTMRTVFSHDHFGPSSIQQHGFYSALVVEPRGTRICPGYGTGNPDDESICMTPQDLDLVEGDETGIGVHKIVKDGDELHPNYREFALAVADFALLYDPSDGQSGDIAAAGGPIGEGLMLGTLPVWQEGGENPVYGPKGLAKLVCEAQFRTALGNQASPGPLQSFCDTGFEWATASDPLETEGIAPALVAAALIEDGEVQELRRHLGLVRLRAGFGEGFARPVNAPERPESISVSHHDPYLVNYRGEPVPLRIGDTSGKSEIGAEEEGDAHEDGEVEDTRATPLPAAVDARMWPASVTLEPEEDPETEPAETANTAFDCFADRDVASGLLSQFKRRNPADPGGALPGLPAPGAFENPGDALGQQIADAASFDDCSIDGQSPGARGDLANVYRSVLTEADGGSDADDLARRPHGDPATPLLETYSDERVQIRLIQGAQEVQHTFNMEGLLWRRHIDQKYPSAAAALDSVLPGQTWWQACREAGRTGIARQHDRWRNGLLAPSDDTAYWDAHSKLVAACDNLEGFTAAQEVGISEHFEIPSAPSKYAVSNRFAVISSDDQNAAEREDPALDYLYHFGSQDAVWNGAWGLMRVFEKLDAAKDVTQELEQSDGACADDAMDDEGLCNISDVLRPVPETVQKDADTADRARGQPPLPEVQAAACPAQAPRIEAYAVAMPLEGGMSYASWDRKQFDPDGLALVHVPKSLALPWLDGVSEDALAAVRAAARPYFRDEPMVIRGNAGDCLSLTVINALGRLDGPAPEGCASSDAGPRDCLGDAPMPRIVSLNVEPDWIGGDEHAAPGPSRLTQKNDINVRPSDQLALTAPMSMLTRAKDAHLPFGINTTVAVKAGEVHHGEYYLGFLRVDWPLIDRLMEVTDVENSENLEQHSLGLLQCSERGLGTVEGAFTTGAQARVDALLAGKDSAFTVITRNTPVASEFGSFTINVLGRTYYARLSEVLDAPENARISPEALQLLVLRSRACFRDLLAVQGLGKELSDDDASGNDDEPRKMVSIFPDATPLHAQPYAFGAVPLKPVSDMFNQLPHGLFGALVVEPIGAEYAGRQMTAGDQGGYEPATPLIQGGMAHRGRAANTVITIPDPFAEDTTATRTFREFVLFYQDGLNLWDTETTNEWLTLTGEVAPIVDDCLICDDSYDLGEKAASYRSAAFHLRSRQGGNPGVEAHSNLNSKPFAKDFFKFKDSLWSNAIRLWALPDEEVVIRVLHPGGRARQRAFVTSGHDYDDLFPGFGFPHSALLAPGKAISAALSAPVQPGCSLWADGPRQVFAAGVWGLIDVLGRDGSTSCGFFD